MKLSALTQKGYIFYIAVVATLMLCLFLRTYQLEEYPAESHVDELSNFYDGYSILETGADRWGLKYPTILRGFGDHDNRPPMYAWLCALSIKVFGYSTFAGRMPSAILGFFSVVLIFLTTLRLGGRLFAFLALLLVTLSPWHIIYSRLGTEPTILPSFFIISSFYLWLKTKSNYYNSKYLLLLGFIIGLGTNTYQSSKLYFLFIAILIAADIFFYASSAKLKKIGFLGLACFAGALPQIYTVFTLPEQFFARTHDGMIDISFSYHFLNTFLRNFFSNLSPEYLFFSFEDYNFLTMGRLLNTEFLFFYLGLFFFPLVHKKTTHFPPVYFYLLIAICLFPSALTTQNPNALRTSGIIVLLPIISATGILFVYRHINKVKWRNFFLLVTISLLLVNLAFFVKHYTQSYFLRSAIQQNHLVQLAKKLNNYKDKYARIYIEDKGHNQPYIYIARYCDMHPLAFQRAIKRNEPIVAGWDHLVQLDKYYFLSRPEIEQIAQEATSKNLYVLQTPNNQYKPLAEIITGKFNFYIYEK
ncbi:MAG: ArnT family glycosyltransferase [Adhaeribacter sp.]